VLTSQWRNVESQARRRLSARLQRQTLQQAQDK